MQTPLQIAFRNFERSEAIAAKIEERANKLESFYDGIIGCRVTVEALHKHHRQGNHYHVRVTVTVPGAELVADREPDEHYAYSDVYVAIRDAFDAMRRQLEDYARQRRRQVKLHESPPHGVVVEIHFDENYGRIETPGIGLVYFHRNSVVDADFDKLEVGTEVRFELEMGERGPQATTVHVIGKHHIIA